MKNSEREQGMVPIFELVLIVAVLALAGGAAYLA